MIKSVDASQTTAEGLIEESSKQFKERSKECESDVQVTISRTIAQIQKTIDAESQATEHRLAGLKDNLAALTKKLQDSIAELRQAHESRLAVVAEDVSNLSQREFENSAAELHIQDYSSAKTLKVQNNFVTNTFQQKLDHGLLEARGEEKQITGRISKSFLQSVNTIDTHTSAWIEKLAQSFDQHSRSLEELFKEGDNGLAKTIAKLVEEVDSHAADVNQKIAEHFEHVSYDLKDEGEAQAQELRDRLSNEHKVTCEELAKMAKDLSAEVAAAGTSGSARLKQTASELKAKVDSSLEKVDNECATRRAASQALKGELESKARELVDSIRKDLNSLHGTFETRLKGLVSSSASELESICQEAESAIAESAGDCERQFKQMSDKSRELIQTKLSELLLRIKKQQDLALEEVMKVASGNAAEEQPEILNPAPKRSKKKKNSSSADDNQGGEK
jgi:DNA anti-recombination protein RmuC